MTTEQLIDVSGAITLSFIVVLAALFARRALNGAGAELRALDASASDAALALPKQLVAARAALSNADSLTERALWSLSNTDERLSGASANMKARRDASDRLRARLIEGKTTISRLRETVRALMRLNEIRRTFWA